jgi:hypothetical protein
VNQPGTPEIAYNAADSFELALMFTNDGTTRIDCAPPNA